MERQRLIIKPIQPNSALLISTMSASRQRAIWFSGCRRRCKGSNPNRVCQTSGAKPPDFYAAGKPAHPHCL